VPDGGGNQNRNSGKSRTWIGFSGVFEAVFPEKRLRVFFPLSQKDELRYYEPLTGSLCRRPSRAPKVRLGRL